MAALSRAARTLAGKSDRDGNWLPLYIHMRDTAAVMVHLVRAWLPPAVRRVLQEGVAPEQLLLFAAFLGYAHDIGKATPLFACAIARSIPWIQDLMARCGLVMEGGYQGAKMSHGLMGEALLVRQGCPEGAAAIVGAHHGKPTRLDFDPEGIPETYPKDFWGPKDARAGWKDVQKELFLWAVCESGVQAREIPNPSRPQQVLWTGLLVMADWIASNTRYFPAARMEDDMREVCAGRTERALRRLALPDPWLPDAESNAVDRFALRFGFSPNAIQRAVLAAVSRMEKPGICILEAPMGTGKTEAALAAGEVLGALAGLGGVFFGLPTQATANGIFPRLLHWAGNLQDCGRHSIRLAHASAQWNEAYCALPRGVSDIGDGQSDSLMVHEWFAGKKQALLSDFVVGTVDQMLMAALRQKHVMLRHIGLAGKVVVVDEVHAYDAYMNQYLERTLQWLGAYGTPVILLSATLPCRRRADLIKAYMGGRAPEGAWQYNRGYPLLTWSDGGAVYQETIRADTPRRSVRVVLREAREDAAFQSLADEVEAVLAGGGCLGIIVNTVDRAQRCAAALRSRLGGACVRSIHARFVSPDRAQAEEKLTAALGRNASARPEKLVVVGTQVLEQSLDIDFDYLITDLCPMDLLLQRIGRLHRHDGRARPPLLGAPVCVVLECGYEPEAGAEAIYGRWLLMRTRAQLLARREINLPDDIPSLVQDLYDFSVALAQERDDAQRARDEHERAVCDRETNARCFRIGTPASSRLLRSIHGLVDIDYREAGGALGDARAQAAVRDGDPSIEVLALRLLGDGTLRCLTQSEGLFYADRAPSEEEARQIARQRIRLPRALCLPWRIEKTVAELEQIKKTRLREWFDSPWLHGELFLLFEEEDAPFCALNGMRMTYSREDGLRIIKEGDEDGG